MNDRFPPRFGPVLVLLAATAGIAATPPPDFTLPLMRTPPALDGRIQADEWRTAARFDGFHFKGKLQRRRVRAWIGATTDALCVAIRSQLPDQGELKADVRRDSLNAVHDDSVEIYVNPTPDLPDNVEYQFLTNSLGRGGYNLHFLGGPNEKPSWRGNWQQAHGFHDGWWDMECIIPIAGMHVVTAGRRTTDGIWTINLARNWKNPWEWSSLTGGYARSGFPFRFVARPLPVVGLRFDSDPALPPAGIRLCLDNPFAVPLEAEARLRLTRNNMPEILREKTCALPSGKQAELRLEIPANDPATRYTLAAEVRAGTDGTVLYRRELAWKRAEAPCRWLAGQKKKHLPVDLRFAFYPYRKIMRLQIDIRGLPPGTHPREVIAEIRALSNRAVQKQLSFPAAAFRDGRTERTFPLDLPNGDYEIAVRALGEGLPADAAATRRFERHVFPWERLPAGRSPTVYPPFTPIRLQGNRLATVLREHELNGFGLVDQVRATSANTKITKPILAAPMRFRAVIDGKAAPLAPAALEVVSAAPNEVRTTGGFSGGPLHAVVHTTWDYDGTARVTVALGSTGGAAVNRLDLEIPFARDTATLIHANADRIRAPVARRLPAKPGLAWDASAVACDDFMPNFCPYVFLGNGVRGLCWFAENDRGWSWDPKTPNLDVFNTAGAAVLRVHLINRPTVIDTPRSITFGLLAAPVKPPLNPARRPRHWWRYRYFRDRYSLLGTDINWFSPGTCGSVYPAGKDLALWQMLARANREKLDRKTIEAFLQNTLKYAEPYGEKKIETWKRHVRYNLRARYGTKMVFYYNRASYQACEEFETFKDEWCLTDFRSIGKGKSLGEIKVVPSGSFIDYNLYWYARSFDIGNNRGVYWDNFFIVPSFNTEMTDAYQRPDGSVVPAAGIWALRELAKRTFVMMNERGMLPVTFAHMTSFSPLPMLSFCTLQYDWEWKYSQGDVQDRFSREYLLLASTGELAGTWPVTLSDHGRLADDIRTQRTFTAVRILHELDGYGGCGRSWNKANKANRPLLDAILPLLDDDRLEVYKYWEDRPQPVTADHPGVFTIVYVIPGIRSVAAVISYDRAPVRTALRVDAAALGFAPASVRGKNVETGEAVALAAGAAPLELPPHDIRVFAFTGTPPKKK